jgi:hypothetical protein
MGGQTAHTPGLVKSESGKGKVPFQRASGALCLGVMPETSEAFESVENLDLTSVF